jgi:hypothetical protein
MRNPTLKQVLAMVSALLLSACAVGPDYRHALLHKPYVTSG